LPLYEYHCNQCGYHIEKIQHFNAEPDRECPKCHGPLHRPLSAPALQFKGAGWYVNDYAAKSPSPKGDKASTRDNASTGDTVPATDGTPSASSASDTHTATPTPAAKEAAASPAPAAAASSPAPSNASTSSNS